MNYIFNPVYTGKDEFDVDVESDIPASDVELFSDELASSRFRLMELPFNESIYRAIGNLNFHQKIYLKDIVTKFESGKFLLFRVNDNISVVSFGFGLDENVDSESLFNTIKMITKKNGVIWPDCITGDFPVLTKIRDVLLDKEMATVKNLGEL
tara:strand:+ start:20405 stop:20863 length:459 start_codon:yes stop_codon:yes gene_type:complete